MKKILLILAVIGIALSSCNGKYTIAKRKYSKGFYVNRSNGNKAKTESIVKTNSPKFKTSENRNTELVVSSRKEIKSNENLTPLVKAERTKLVHKENKIIHHDAVVASSEKLAFPSQKTYKKVELNNKHITPGKSNSDSDFIVQVILSLFPVFCLIGVYLHDGKAITLNFWIDLLLHLTIYGECIFAILVVLDIIDLK